MGGGKRRQLMRWEGSGLSLRVRLLRSLPERFKVDIKVKEGTHQSENAGALIFGAWCSWREADCARESSEQAAQRQGACGRCVLPLSSPLRNEC